MTQCHQCGEPADRDSFLCEMCEHDAEEERRAEEQSRHEHEIRMTDDVWYRLAWERKQKAKRDQERAEAEER